MLTTEIATCLAFLLLTVPLGLSMSAPPPVSYVLAVIWIALFVGIYRALFGRRRNNASSRSTS